MSNCLATTSKGYRCKNKEIDNKLCHVHSKLRKRIVVIHFLTDDSYLLKNQLYCGTDIQINYEIIYIAIRDDVAERCSPLQSTDQILVYCKNTTDKILHSIFDILKYVKNATFISAGGILVPENIYFRVLNASYDNIKRYRVVRVIDGKKYHMVNIPYDEKTDLLNCQWWFIWFI